MYLYSCIMWLYQTVMFTFQNTLWSCFAVSVVSNHMVLSNWSKSQCKHALYLMESEGLPQECTMIVWDLCQERVWFYDQEDVCGVNWESALHIQFCAHAVARNGGLSVYLCTSFWRSLFAVFVVHIAMWMKKSCFRLSFILVAISHVLAVEW